MHQLYPQLRAADALVLAAPVYSMGMPALPKAMVDRCQPFWALKYVLKRNLVEPGGPERWGAFLCCAGTAFTHVFDGTRQVVRYLWHVLEVNSAGELFVRGWTPRGDHASSPRAGGGGGIGRRLGRPRLVSVETVDVTPDQTKGSAGNRHAQELHKLQQTACRPRGGRRRTGTGTSRSTGGCDTYRVWFCVNPECVMFKTDLYREQIADRSDR